MRGHTQGRAGRRAAVALAVAALAAATPAAAAPVDVSLRIEGRSATLFEGPLRTDARAVDGNDGSGAHSCGGGRPTVAGALADAAERGGFAWRGAWNPDFQDFFVERIGGDASSTAAAAFWAVLVDGRYSGGACATALTPGARILWAYDTANRPFVLSLTGPARAAIGEAVAVEVRDGWIRADSGADGGPIAGATVGGATTDASGRATLRFDSAGLKRLKAERPDAIRSNTLDICVGDAGCAGALPPPAEPRPPASRPTARVLPTARTVLVRGVRYLRRARAARPLSRPALRRVRRALRLARPALAGEALAWRGAGHRRPTAAQVRRLRRCSRGDGAIVCGRAAARRPVRSTARAITSLAIALAARRSRGQPSAERSLD